MLNIAETLYAWCREARPFALATVVDVSGSAPLPPGTALAVSADGDVIGSVSGGCVEERSTNCARRRSNPAVLRY
ncbi:xanthine/CO dehydrogenase XdhC/CoxF family maturation factor [Streptomyces sp. V4I23]|uniref:XdhC family protein n=1 Tax=Streptomyces sp. V4I23 TaxID=3042282 RepID=UPI00277F2278|nr:XdhC family protein [Streptomyces sp. V4I23]MDQ1007822.1 xanthine/CO dehydrogenase XdhC/CoxF family maturation factor [Streptomyces sp. V4I23]